MTYDKGATLTENMADFLRRLPLMQNEAMRLGLHVTARQINKAVRASGWEATGDLVAAGKAARRDPQ